MNNINVLRLAEIEELLKDPHLTYIEETVLAKKKVSLNVLSRKPEDVLLISSSGFLVDSVLAGLTEAQLEHIARFGPKNYKENILKGFGEKRTLEEVMNIAKTMDGDLGGGTNRNQQRIESLLRYIKDNQKVFQF